MNGSAFGTSRSENTDAIKYFEVDFSPLAARVLPASGTIDCLNLKLAQIGAIASLLICQDGLSEHVAQNAVGAIQSMAHECEAISRALWAQMNGAVGASS